MFSCHVLTPAWLLFPGVSHPTRRYSPFSKVKSWLLSDGFWKVARPAFLQVLLTLARLYGISEAIKHGSTSDFISVFPIFFLKNEFQLFWKENSYSKMRKIFIPAFPETQFHVLIHCSHTCWIVSSCSHSFLQIQFPGEKCHHHGAWFAAAMQSTVRLILIHDPL